MKKKDMATLIDGIRRLADDLTFIGDVLEGKDPASVQAEPEKTKDMKAEPEAAETQTKHEEAEPATEEPKYTFEQVRGILAEKSRSGHREAVKAMITRHGGAQLSDFKDKPDILAEMAKEAEGF